MHTDPLPLFRQRNPARGPARVAVAVVLCCAATVAMASSAPAQMFKEAWNFKPRDRASLAVVQKQVEEGMFSNSSASTGGGSGTANSTLLICGGGEGTSSSKANSSCIILNNATGDLNVGQDSTGDQSATTDTETNQTTADEVANILGQGTAGDQ